MEPLHILFQKAQKVSILKKLSHVCDTFRISLYADDASLFINTTKQEVAITDFILQLFADASGLITNLAKTCYYPISREGLDLQFIFCARRIVSSLPCTYLGLPLHFKKHNRATLQHLLHKIGSRLPRWKRGFFSYPGRELLVKSILSAMPTHFITVFKMPKWTIYGIEKFRRSFLWGGTDLEKYKRGTLFSKLENMLETKETRRPRHQIH
jgi:hypothetical protein